MNRFIIIMLGFLLFFSTSAKAADEVLRGAVFPLPGNLINNADSGLFIDVLKEIEKCLPKNVKVSRTMYPPSRAYINLSGPNPISDFAFPGIANPRPEIQDPFLYSKPMGKVSFVIYSNVSKPITREMLLEKINEKKYPYSIESFPNVTSYFPFPTQGFTCVDCALKKVSAGRLDAYIMAMEDVDDVIRKENIKSIHRELYADFDAIIPIAKGTRGEQVKKLLDAATECAMKTGNLKELYEKVHRPFTKW